MKSDKETPGIAKTLTAMHAREIIPSSRRRTEIRARLLESFPEISLAVFKTQLGWIGVGWSSHGIVALNLPRVSREQAIRDLRQDYPSAAFVESAPAKFSREITEYAEGRRDRFDLALDWSFIKPFQRAVLAAAKKIPFGETRSYRWIAKQIGNPRASRAVGRALGANPIPIILPCHRVISSDGGLGGYAGGLKLKARLLQLEGAHLS